jgi:chemosensory pili system protein ChpA (sensor histidine kinase/response regulator)
MSRILLVDDDAVIVKVYSRKLEEHGHQVKTARDGLEAMRIVQWGRPDLVVLDVMMPHFDGYEVLKFIRSCVAST